MPLTHPGFYHVKSSEFGKHAVWIMRYSDKEHFPFGRHRIRLTSGDEIDSAIKGLELGKNPRRVTRTLSFGTLLDRCITLESKTGLSCRRRRWSSVLSRLLSLLEILVRKLRFRYRRAIGMCWLMEGMISTRIATQRKQETKPERNVVY